MTVLVTGATGLLGGHVAGLLRDRGEQVRALVRPEEDASGLAGMGVELQRGDLADVPSLHASVRGVRRVVHCAARTGPWGPRAEYAVANVRGVKALLEAALAAGVERFVHVSSAIVVGTDAGGSLDETAPFKPEPNPYSWSKIEGERIVQDAIRARRAPAVIVRPGLVYGPRDRGSFGRFAALIEQRRMVVMGSGENHLPLAYVGDVAEGIVRASETQRAEGHTYFLVNDELVTQNDYLRAIAAELGVEAPRRHVPYRAALLVAAAAEHATRSLRRPGPPPLTRFGVRLLGGENRPSIRRAREDLGFEPRVSMMEGVREGVAWYRVAMAPGPARGA
ncbi:NAD-dependent epimerase/dehydratase family protein [Anaeromyxobacter oryzisoli]|uniref:NAD-dependent epimerase/dehydratase family protein n=1 Tax=Anaeromyxobacter oryzisoli TaxID=2925408 RepID=UPI001F590759|nr:NAD-dependent epimerase/dehydratase family protein [Anaeromyxobacter sp. SG63]